MEETLHEIVSRKDLDPDKILQGFMGHYGLEVVVWYVDYYWISGAYEPMHYGAITPEQDFMFDELSDAGQLPLSDDLKHMLSQRCNVTLEDLGSWYSHMPKAKAKKMLEELKSVIKFIEHFTTTGLDSNHFEHICEVNSDNYMTSVSCYYR